MCAFTETGGAWIPRQENARRTGAFSRHFRPDTAVRKWHKIKPVSYTHLTLTAKRETVNPKLTALNMELARVEDEIEKLLNTLTGANAVLLLSLIHI